MFFFAIFWPTVAPHRHYRHSNNHHYASNMGAKQSSNNTVPSQPQASSSTADAPTYQSNHSSAHTTGHAEIAEGRHPQAPKSARGSPGRSPSNKKNESGFQRAQRKCRKKKRAYDACYTAQLSNKEEDCADLFDAYRSCFMSAMSRDMEKRGVQVNSNSMVGEFKDENTMNDDE